MRIKFSEDLFKQEDVDFLIEKMKESHVDIQLIKKSSASYKGILDDSAFVSWILTAGNAFLPIIMDIFFTYVKNKKTKALFDIELRETDGTEKKITVSSDNGYSALELQVRDDGDIRIFITKD